MAKRRIFLAGPMREIPGGQDWPILPAPMVIYAVLARSIVDQNTSSNQRKIDRRSKRA